MQWLTQANDSFSADTPEDNQLLDKLQKFFEIACQEAGLAGKCVYNGHSRSFEYFLYTMPLHRNGTHGVVLEPWSVDSVREAQHLFNDIPPYFGIAQTTKTIRVAYLHVERSINDCFAYLDTLQGELKAVSFGLATERGHRVRVYKSQNENVLLIYSNRPIDSVAARRIIACLPAVYPEWAAELNVPHELFTTLVLDKDVWWERFKQWAQDTNLLEDYTTQSMLRFLDSVAREEQEETSERIAAYRVRIRDLEKALSQKYKDMREVQLQLLGAQQTTQENLRDFIDYCKGHKSICSMHPASSYALKLIISTPCNYDKALVTALLDGSNRWTEFKRELIKIIFIEQKYTLFFKAPVVLNFKEALVSARDENFRHATSGCLGWDNPHLLHHNCWGQNRNYIEKALRERNYIVALEQAITAVGNLHWLDGVVVDEFLADLNEGRTTGFVALDEEGAQVTLQDIIERENIK